MNKRIQGMCLVVGLVLIMVAQVGLFAFDSYISGDEVVTLSMANNDQGGFVFSDGRVASYFKERIFTDSISGTVSNLGAFVGDILKNKKSAEFFSFPRDQEIAVYSNEQINDWFTKREDERFNLGKTWLFSMSDDANSYLYYCVINFVSSLFTGISGTKWVAFIANMIFYVICLVLIYNIAKKVGMTPPQSVIAVMAWASSVIVLTTVTYIRTYVLATMLALVMVYLHLCMLEVLRANRNAPIGKYIAGIIVTYLFSYISHYTNMVALGALGLITLLWFLSSDIPKKKLTQYCVGMIGAGMLGLLADPTSVLGLASKLMGTVKGKAGENSFFDQTWETFSSQIFPNAVVCLFMLGITCATVFVLIQRRKQNSGNGGAFYGIRYLAYIAIAFFAVILLGTKRLSYGRVMLPVVAIVCVKITDYFIHNVVRCKEKYLSVTAGVMAAVVVVCGLWSGFRSLEAKNAETTELSSALVPYRGADVFYFRHRASGYWETLELRQMQAAQVITVDTQNWEQIADPNFSNKEEVLVFFTADTYDSDTETWLREHGWILEECLYNRDGTTIYYAVRM